MQELVPYSEPEVRAISTAMAKMEGPLLPILHAVHKRFGHIPRPAVPVIADVLNLTRAEVHGVVSFYADFRTEPASGPEIRICRAEACQSKGGKALWLAASTLLPSAEAVYCLGLCSVAPAAMVEGQLHGRLSVERLVELIGSAGS